MIAKRIPTIHPSMSEEALEVTKIYSVAGLLKNKGTLIKTHCELDSDSTALLKQAFLRFKYSARTYHKFLKPARTFADMEASTKIHKPHLIKALLCREIEKEQVNFKVL